MKYTKKCGYHFTALQRGTPPSEATDKTNNQPHIVVFSDDNEDVTKQYFIAVEQDLMMETSTPLAALFFLFAAHYICFQPQLSH